MSERSRDCTIHRDDQGENKNRLQSKSTSPATIRHFTISLSLSSGSLSLCVFYCYVSLIPPSLPQLFFHFPLFQLSPLFVVSLSDWLSTPIFMLLLCLPFSSSPKTLSLAPCSVFFSACTLIHVHSSSSGSERFLLLANCCALGSRLRVKKEEKLFPSQERREWGKLTVEIVQCCCVLHRYWLYVHIAFIYSSTRAAVRETVGSDEKSGCIYFVVTSSKWYDVKFVKLRSCCWWGEEFSRACECACRAVMVGKSEWKRGKLLEESMK